MTREDNKELETTLTTQTTPKKNPVGRPKGVHKYGMPAKEYYKLVRKHARDKNKAFFEEHPINELPKDVKKSYDYHILGKKTPKLVVPKGVGDFKEVIINITLRK